jgi:serine/threonine-protein kinase HipA
MYDFDHNLAMAYGDEFNPDEVFAYQLREFSEQVGMNYKLVSKVLVKECDKIIKTLEDDIIDRELLIEEESVFIAKLSEFILKRANRFRAIGLEMAFVSFP